MSKATGLLSVSIYLDCPGCGETHDLFAIDELNDEGQLWDEIKNYWQDRDMDPGVVFDCPDCKKPIHWNKLEY